MGGIDVTFQDEALSAIRKKLGDMEKRAPSVQANALNKTQTVLKKYLPQEALKQYTYKRKIQKPRQQRASRKKLTATLFYDRKDPGLNYFDYTPGISGSPPNTPGAKLAARVRSDGGLKNIDRAFAADINGMKVWQRDESKRFPISRLFGPSEHNMVHHVWQEKTAQDYTAEMLSKKLDEQINNQYLKKWGLK